MGVAKCMTLHLGQGQSSGAAHSFPAICSLSQLCFLKFFHTCYIPSPTISYGAILYWCNFKISDTAVALFSMQHLKIRRDFCLHFKVGLIKKQILRGFQKCLFMYHALYIWYIDRILKICPESSLLPFKDNKVFSFSCFLFSWDYV